MAANAGTSPNDPGSAKYQFKNRTYIAVKAKKQIKQSRGPLLSGYKRIQILKLCFFVLKLSGFFC